MMMDVWIIWMDAICLQSFRAKRSERERAVLKERGKWEWGAIGDNVQ